MKANMIKPHYLILMTNSRDLFQIDFAARENGFVGTRRVHARGV